MITLYGFGRVFPKVIGETRDLRIEWALQEVGLPYRVHGLDHAGGEHKGEAYGELNCFRLVPVLDDDGFVVTESAAILLYLAEKAGKLIPGDFQGRTRVVQWCFAAVSTVERPLMEIQLIDKFGGGEGAAARRAEMVKAAHRWFDGLERRLDGRTWIACDDFTVADILLTSVLREIRKTDLLTTYPRLSAYYARALARPQALANVESPEAWLRTVAINVVRRRWRRRKMLDAILLRDRPVQRLVEAGPGPERPDLRDAIAELPRAYREVIVLHYLADLSVEEVAAVLDVPVGTVKSRLFRGRSALAARLTGYRSTEVAHA